MGELYELDVLELLSQQGITFNQYNQGGENGIIHHHLPKKLLDQYESRITDQKEIITMLKTEIGQLSEILKKME